MPDNLTKTKTLVFDKCGFEIKNTIIEKESTEYDAHQFELNQSKVVFRVAKITPTKIGQFVTLWKRIAKGPIQPFNLSDDLDFFVINTQREDRLGQFVFPKAILSQQGIITTNSKEGKRAIRVYPPWDITISKQAQKTQQWQLNYFLEIPQDKPLDINRAKLLYTSENH